MMVRAFTLTCIALAALTSGCNRSGTPTTTRTTTTTETMPATSQHDGGGVDVNAGSKGAIATGRGANGGVDVNVGPNGGVDVDVQGEPIRDRIRERRAAREAASPR